MKYNLFIFVSIILVCLFFIKMYTHRKTTKLDTHGIEILNHLESPYQTIDLVKDKNTNDICMFLNGTIQNHTKEYQKSHYAMVDISIKMLNKAPEKILILGGGDGYPAMRALKQPNVYVKNIEIDDTLINFVKTNPTMRKLTQDAFNDPKLDLAAMDAYKYIYEEKNKFDLIVYDIARETTNNTVTDFTRHDEYIVEHILSDDGIMNYTMDLHSDIPEFKDIYRKYLTLQENSLKPNFMLLLDTKEEFDTFSKSCPINIIKLKERYPNSEIGISMYNLDCHCGNYQYNEELYFYISKQPFNKASQDIEFFPFEQI